MSKRNVQPVVLEGALLEELTPLQKRIAAAEKQIDGARGEIVQSQGDIKKSETAGIEARWEFGRQLLRHKNSKKLPNGLLRAVAKQFNIREREVQYRVDCAEKFETIDQLCARARDYPKGLTWKKMCREVLAEPQKPTIQSLQKHLERLNKKKAELQAKCDELQAELDKLNPPAAPTAVEDEPETEPVAELKDKQEVDA